MRVIVNVATGRYWKGQLRLMESIMKHWGGDTLFFSDTEQIPSCPTHLDNPYAFKPYAFEYAISKGYTSILWLDASVYLEKSPVSVFEHIEKEGYIMQEAGHYCGTWANDKCLEYFGVSRDTAMNMPMYGNAGFLGLSKDSKLAMDFLRRWKDAAVCGMFKGSWINTQWCESHDSRCKGHRHDMVCGSIIANQLKMKYQPGDQILEYKAPSVQAANDTIIFGAQGI